MIQAPIAGRKGDGHALSALAADLTPLIDVLFMLIVFMILTANSAELALDATLSTTEEQGLEAAQAREAVVVVVGGTGETAAYRVEGTAFAGWDEAKGRLRNVFDRTPDRPIRIATAPDAPAQRVVDLMAFLQTRGITDAQLILHKR